VADVEELVGECLRRILTSDDMTQKLSGDSREREKFFTQLIFSA